MRDLKFLSLLLNEQISEHLYDHVNQEHNQQEETLSLLFLKIANLTQKLNEIYNLRKGQQKAF